MTKNEAKNAIRALYLIEDCMVDPTRTRLSKVMRIKTILYYWRTGTLNEKPNKVRPTIEEVNRNP